MQRQVKSPRPRNSNNNAKVGAKRKKKVNNQSDAVVDALEDVQYSIDILTAILLLTGQITTTGIFVVPDGIAFAATGDIFGPPRNDGRTKALSLDIDFIDVVSAILLILGQVRVQGPYFSGVGLVIVYSGPIFGYKSVPVIITKPTPQALMFGQVLREMVIDRLDAM